MGIFDRFRSNPSTPKGYSEVKFDFTEAPSFKSEDEMWAYVEEQEEILNQLEDVFSKVKKKLQHTKEFPNRPHRSKRLNGLQITRKRSSASPALAPGPERGH
jgi:hypothetical protein